MKLLLTDFDVKTVGQMGWTGIDNGALLKAAEREFDAFVTVDKNLSFQQNLTGFAIYEEVGVSARSIARAFLLGSIGKNVEPSESFRAE